MFFFCFLFHVVYGLVLYKNIHFFCDKLCFVSSSVAKFTRFLAKTKHVLRVQNSFLPNNCIYLSETV